MLTVVADTNIYVSALSFGGVPERFLRLAAAGAFRLAISEPILTEIAKVLRSAKFQWPEEATEKAQRQIAQLTVQVEIGRPLHIITADPSDNRILECAAAAQAAYIVSGDKHLLRLLHFEGTPVVKVADFLYRMQSQQPER